MAVGDWASGSYIKFDVGAQLVLNEDQSINVGLRYWIVLPSTNQVWPPNGNMFTATELSPTETLATVVGTVAQGLANQEGIPVQLADGTTVQPAS